MIGETPIYQRIEKSKFGSILMVIGAVMLFGVWFLPSLPKDVTNTRLMMTLISLFLILTGYTTSRLYINGYYDRLVIQYGKFGPLKVTVFYSQIRSVERMKIPIVLRMQTGMRMNFGGWFFNPGTSNDAVKIQYGRNKVVTVGTTDPDGLKNFIEQQLASSIRFS